jgi:hypothetical protein
VKKIHEKMSLLAREEGRQNLEELSENFAPS